MTTPPLNSSDHISDDKSDDFQVIEGSNESLCEVSAENYLSLPEEVLVSSSITELQNAIENCRTMILATSENSEKRKWLVRRLTELRLRLENIRDFTDENSSDNSVNEKNKVVLGHHFSLQNFPTSTLQYYCDRCSGIIWNILHSWYLCADCNYKCHVKCLSNVCRVCAHIVVTENPMYILDICPEAENGLANQNYRCAECLTVTSFNLIFPRQFFIMVSSTYNSGFSHLGCVFATDEARSENLVKCVTGKLNVPGSDVMEPRLCDYTGKYYCSTCHWNSTSVIPARVIYNWDFKERIVCRSSKQILNLMVKLPILKLEELNPILFVCIEELEAVKQLRHQLMQIKKYLTSCKFALEHQLLWKSSDKHHFLENEDSYSLQDLLELRSGELIRYLNKHKDDFIKHIKVDCEVCKGRGFYCELCEGNTIIFPFEENSILCSKCQSTFHFMCWVNNNEQCPKCNRIQKRSLKNQSDFSYVADS